MTYEKKTFKMGDKVFIVDVDDVADYIKGIVRVADVPKEGMFLAEVGDICSVVIGVYPCFGDKRDVHVGQVFSSKIEAFFYIRALVVAKADVVGDAMDKHVGRKTIPKEEE